MRSLGKWVPYTPDPTTLSPDVRPHAHRLMFFVNEYGQDWYSFQKMLPPGVYAMRDADGTILQIQRDLTKLAPVRGELVQLDIPDTIDEDSLIGSLHGVVMDDEEGITVKRVPLRINSLEFMQRFTPAERKAIRKSSNEDVADFFDLLRASTTYFGLDNPLVLQGLDLLVAVGLISAERRAEILTDDGA